MDNKDIKITKLVAENQLLLSFLNDFIEINGSSDIGRKWMVNFDLIKKVANDCETIEEFREWFVEKEKDIEVFFFDKADGDLNDFRIEING